jgi:cell division protein FtsQ
MDRSLAARLTRPLRLPGPPRTAGARARPRAGSRPPAAIALPGLLAPLTRARRAIGALALSLWTRRRARLVLLGLVVSVPLLGGGWLWLRDSSFVAVQRVRVIGVHGPQAAAIDAALVNAAHHMTTLDVQPGALRAAVASYPIVREVRAIASFPHGLSIRVVEQQPVAALVIGGTRTAIAADGIALGPALLTNSLPTVAGWREPNPGQRVSDPGLLGSLALLGAAPGALAKRVTSVFVGPRGLTVAMRNGLLIYFGDATLPHAKWLSLARVLADPSSTGASYVDVRLPSRPAAGFPGGVAPSAVTSTALGSSPERSGAAESTVGALAAGLAPRGAAGTPAAGTESGSASAETSTAPTESSGPAQAPAAGSSETTPPAATEAPPTSNTPGG